MNEQDNNVKYDETWLHRYQQGKLSSDELEEYELYLLDHTEDVVEVEIEESITEALNFERMKDKYEEIMERKREVKKKLVVSNLMTLAACVLVAVIGWFSFTDDKALAPGSGQVVYVENYRSSNADDVTEVIAKAGEPLVLVFSDLIAEESYLFELRNEKGNELVSQLELVSSEDGEISYVIPSDKSLPDNLNLSVSNKSMNGSSVFFLINRE